MRSTLYKKKSPLIVFLLPAFIFMLIFLYYPFIVNIFNSFKHIPQLGGSAVGYNTPWYSNYVEVFKDKLMLTALKNTFFIMFLTVLFQVGIALLLALLVDNIKLGKQFFRTVYFFPIVISATALGLLFNLIFLYDGGMLNNLLLNLGMKNLIDWKDKSHFMMTMSAPIMWQYVGFYFVILVTGLSNIPQDIYEAAKIDGANTLNQVFYIKLPLLYNNIISCVILAITGALKVFDLPFIMFRNGMPLDNSWLTGTYMYHQTFDYQNVDYGSTIAVVIVILGISISAITENVFKPKEY